MKKEIPDKTQNGGNTLETPTRYYQLGGVSSISGTLVSVSAAFRFPSVMILTQQYKDNLFYVLFYPNLYIFAKYFYQFKTFPSLIKINTDIIWISFVPAILKSIEGLFNYIHCSHIQQFNATAPSEPHCML